MFSTAAPRCASRSIRFSPTPTSMRSGSITIRRSPTGATRRNHADLAEARSVYDVDYLRRRLGSGEAFDWYYADAIRAQRADAHADHRRRLRQAMGLPRRRISSPGGRTGMWSASDGVEIARDRMACRNRSRSGSPRSAFRPSTRGRTDRTSFPIRNPPNPPIRRSPAARATISCRRAGSRRSCRVSIRAQRGFAAAYNPVSPLYGGRMVDPAQHLRLGLGRTALSRLPRFRHRLGGRRQLGDRPLDHGPHRGRDPRPADRRASCGISALRDPGRHSRRRLRRRLCDRPADVGARRARAAGCASSASMRSRAAARSRGRAAAVARSIAPDEGRSRARRQGAVAALTRAQETELPQQVELGFTEGETDYRRAAVASRRLSGASRREAQGGQRHRHAPRRGAAPRRYLAAGSVGRRAKAPSSSCRRGASSSSRAT